MDQLGINIGFLLVQLFNIGILVLWPLLSLVALFALRRRHLTDIAQALWTLIVLFPLFGPLAFLIVQPGRKDQPG